MREYQKEAFAFAFSRLAIDNEMGAGLFLDPGLGKTLITLKLIMALRRIGLAKRTLVIAPLRVVHNVWPEQVRHWKIPLRVVMVHGTPATRSNALITPGDLFLTTPKLTTWLAGQPNNKFDLVVCDESTVFKTPGSERTKGLLKLLKSTPKRLILTGTPAPNDYHDLYSQIYILDQGRALGKNVTRFREWACKQDEYRKWSARAGSTKLIEEKIAPLVIRMSSEDHLDLPPMIHNPIWIDLPSTARRVYNEIEKDLFSELDNGQTLTASSAGAKYAKCKSLANGGGYETDEDTHERRTVHVHDAKVDAVEEIVDELGGKPLLVAYQFNHDAERLLRRFPKTPVIRGGMPANRVNDILDGWNRKELPLLFVQPQALSHGVNMQSGGNNLVWFGHTDQLEIYLQLGKRLHRQGTVGTVVIHHILARETVDQAVYERLQMKDGRQIELLESLKRYREGRR